MESAQTSTNEAGTSALSSMKSLEWKGFMLESPRKMKHQPQNPSSQLQMNQVSNLQMNLGQSESRRPQKRTINLD